MDCDAVRVAMSARLDGESSELPEDVVEAHVAGCPECQRWFATVSTLGRQLKFNLAPEAASSTSGEDAAARLLGASQDFPQVTGQLRARSLPLVFARLALAALAIVFLVWAGVLLFGPALGVGLPGEAESVSSAEDAFVNRLIMDAATIRFALGVGLGWAAFRPKTAAALLPVYLATWAFGAGIATRDVVMGLVGPTVELPAVVGSLVLHLIAVVALITCWLARLHAVTPLKQYWRLLTAQPMSFSVSDVERHSTFRPGD